MLRTPSGSSSQTNGSTQREENSSQSGSPTAIRRQGLQRRFYIVIGYDNHACIQHTFFAGLYADGDWCAHGAIGKAIGDKRPACGTIEVS